MPDPKLTDVLIVGAGPAGISCAVALQQLGLTAVVLESRAQCGGRLLPALGDLSSVTPGDGHMTAPIQALNLVMLSQSLDLRLGQVVVDAMAGRGSVAVALADGTLLGARYLVLAQGVTPRDGGFAPREGLTIGPGPVPAVARNLEFQAAVLGGGDSAFQAYQALREAGYARVTIFARHLRASSRRVQAVPLEDIRLGDCDVNPHRNEINGQPFDQVQVCYGYAVAPDSMLGLDLGRTDDGLVRTDDHGETTVPRVFAIGDMTGRLPPSGAAAFAQGLIVARELQRRLESPVLEALEARLRQRLPESENNEE